MNKNIIKKYIIASYIFLLTPVGHSMESYNNEEITPSPSQYQGTKALHEEQIQGKFESLQKKIITIFDAMVDYQESFLKKKEDMLNDLKKGDKTLFKGSEKVPDESTPRKKEEYADSFKVFLDLTGDHRDFLSSTSSKNLNSPKDLERFIKALNKISNPNKLYKQLFLDCNNFFDIFRCASSILSKIIIFKYNDLLNDEAKHAPYTMANFTKEIKNTHSSKHYLLMPVIMRECLPYIHRGALENLDIFNLQFLRGNDKENKKRTLIRHYNTFVAIDKDKENRDNFAHDFYHKFKNIPALLFNYTPKIVEYLTRQIELLPSLESQCLQFFALYTDVKSNYHFAYQEKESAWIKKIRGASNKNKKKIKNEYEKDKKEYIESFIKTLVATLGSALPKCHQKKGGDSSRAIDQNSPATPFVFRINLTPIGDPNPLTLFEDEDENEKELATQNNAYPWVNEDISLRHHEKGRSEGPRSNPSVDNSPRPPHFRSSI